MTAKFDTDPREAEVRSAASEVADLRERVRARTAGPWREVASAAGMFLLGALTVIAWPGVSKLAMQMVVERGTSHFEALVRDIAPPRGLVFTLCAENADDNCVVDGDTLHVSGMVVRIADVDTPEIFSARCPAEKALGELATQRLVSVLNEGPFEIRTQGRDEDAYGRTLRILSRGGVSLGETLIAGGLARRWDGMRHPWC
jgi:endonuclease YncB( thermonuclease family)